MNVDENPSTENSVDPLERSGWLTGGVSAAVCAVLSFGGLLLIPVIARVDADAPDLDMLALGTWRWWVFSVVLLAQSAVLIWAWREPRTVFGIVVVLLVPGALFGPGPDVHLSTPAVMVAMFTIAGSEPLRRAIVLAICAAVVMITADALSGIDGDPSFGIAEGAVIALPQSALTLIPPLLLAAFVRSRRELRKALEERVDALERERAAVVRAAVAEERTSMARELHDVAAHHLSGIAIMAAAVEGMIDSDSEAAKSSVRQIRTQSKSLLANIREVVGLLRTGEVDAADGKRLASLEGIEDLVQQMRSRNVVVDLDVITEADDDHRDLSAVDGLGPLAEVAAFRMVQESLANATLHAPGAWCRVVVDDRAADAVNVSVENGPADVGPFRSRRSGLGLVGMRERAALTGATLEYGPTSDDGWMVSLSIPRDPVDTDTACETETQESTA